ncbi:MAG: hypothetical protein HY301_18035 [Verrucomicrobia bacterium]|nr:hypothetical protein [Verrucomicrobiota bacterium]
MKHTLILLAFAALIAMPSPALAQKEKSADVTGLAFFTAKKRGHVAQFVPGLTAALQLSAQQKADILAAREEIFSAEGVASSRRIQKNDPSVTDAQKQAARAAMEQAEEKFRERLATLLTAEQGDLIAKIDKTYQDAQVEMAIAYEDRFGSVKDDAAAREKLHIEQAEDLEALFVRKLNALLSPALKEAMTAAAEIEKQRKESVTKVKKPSK